MTITYLPAQDVHCVLLEPHIRRADKIEIAANGMSSLTSLRFGLAAGPAWAVIEAPEEGRPDIHQWPEVLGIGGYTNVGAIWSYWRDLTPEQVGEIMQWTPDWMRGIREHAGERELRNYVWEHNRAARLWLRASHCFDMEEDERKWVDIDGLRFIPFRLKTSLELARV